MVPSGRSFLLGNLLNEHCTGDSRSCVQYQTDMLFCIIVVGFLFSQEETHAMQGA